MYRRIAYNVCLRVHTRDDTAVSTVAARLRGRIKAARAGGAGD